MSHFFEQQLFRLLPLHIFAFAIVWNQKTGHQHARCFVFFCLLFESVCVVGWALHIRRLTSRQSSQSKVSHPRISDLAVHSSFAFCCPDIDKKRLRTTLVKVTVIPTWAAYAIPSPCSLVCDAQPMWMIKYRGNTETEKRLLDTAVCQRCGEMDWWCKQICTFALLWCPYVECVRIYNNGCRIISDCGSAMSCRNVPNKRLWMRCRTAAIVHGQKHQQTVDWTRFHITLSYTDKLPSLPFIHEICRLLVIT